jgi:hypothetical protein
MKRRWESDQPEIHAQLHRAGPDVDVLRMQAQVSFQEQPAEQEPQRLSQEDGSFLNQIYRLLQSSPQEIEQRLEMGDPHQQNPHPERLIKGQASSQPEAPFPQAAEAVSEQADEATCHQIVEHLMNPQEKKRLPPLSPDEHQRIRKILKEKRNEETIDPQSYKRFVRKLNDTKYREKHRGAIRARDAKYREKHRGAIRARDAKYREKHREALRTEGAKYREKRGEALRVEQAKYYQENRETIRARDAKYYKENGEAVRAKKAKYREENRETIRARDVKYYKENREAIRARRAEYRKRLQDPHNLIKFLERTLQQVKSEYDQESAALRQDIQSLREQWPHALPPVQVAELERLLAEKQTLLQQTDGKWNALRAKKEQSLEKAQRLVEILGELTTLLQQAHSHAQQQEATSPSEGLPLRQAQDQSESPHSPAVTHESRFEEIYNELCSLLQAPHQAAQRQAVEHWYAEYQGIEHQLDEELETLLASFHELDTFEPGNLFEVSP